MLRSVHDRRLLLLRGAPVTIEREAFHVEGVGHVVAFRHVKGRTRDAREASASRLGIFEWNRNNGVVGWSAVPASALAGKKPGYHVRSPLRRLALAAYFAIRGAQ